MNGSITDTTNTAEEAQAAAPAGEPQNTEQGSVALEALVLEQKAELEKLRAVLKDRNNEAAERRVRAREAENTAKTLEEQVAALQARADEADRKAALNATIAAHGLKPEHATFLGSDPEKFDELAKQLKAVIGSAPLTPASAQADGEIPAPLGVERLKGGINPGKEVDDFDPAAIIARHRNKR